ncbi:MAG: N-acetylmuramoyl-L-alanine amidase [Myxococcota bacterium]
MRVRALLAALALAAVAPACREEPAAVGPPRCEPPTELLLERGLKRGYRAVAEGKDEEAEEAFREVLDLEEDHPEARAGLRMLRSPRGERAEAEEQASPGHVVLAGEEVPVSIPVDTVRFRAEELRARRRLGRDMGLEGWDRPVPTYFTQRRGPDGERIPPDDAAAIRERIDLVVLHASRTQTAREAYLRLSSTGASTHFTIDWDGSVHQNLDLAFEATHSGDAALDTRSVSIDLVNPVTTDRPPLPEDAETERFRRPLSEFVSVHGEETRQWGYTAEQMDAVVHLLRELVRVLPRVPGRVPGDGEVPTTVLHDRGRSFRGIVGHLHVTPRATDPGPGFDWQAVRSALR